VCVAASVWAARRAVAAARASDVIRVGANLALAIHALSLRQSVRSGAPESMYEDTISSSFVCSASRCTLRCDGRRSSAGADWQ